MQDEILQKYEIRKSNWQKAEFIEYIKDRLAKAGYNPKQDIAVEEKGRGLLKSRNIVVGNPAEAEVLFGGHYDTCAWMPFPNFMAPTNPVLFWGYQILLTVMIFVSAAFIGFIAGLLCDNNGAVAYFAFLFALIVFMIQMMVGFRNKHTANDNTSGVTAVIDIMRALPEDSKDKAAFVLFDLEETGLFGSSSFASKHKKIKKSIPVINFDCVSDGETMLFALKRTTKKYRELLEKAFVSDSFVTVEIADKAFYPSDNSSFKGGIGVAALKRSSLFGVLYMDRIHTKKDVVYREENIRFLTDGAIKLTHML